MWCRVVSLYPMIVLCAVEVMKYEMTGIDAFVVFPVLLHIGYPC